MFIKLTISLVLVNLCKTSIGDPEKYWQGNWFPGDPGAVDTNDVLLNKEYFGKSIDDEKDKKNNTVDLFDEKHGIKMGISNPDCDDAKRNLTVDWDESSLDYTCTQKKFKVNHKVHPKKVCDHVPRNFVAIHYCMNTTIHYGEEIPTFGHHRPLWAKYGEFKYLPKQRWLHNLEHGGIVMLYHPCANPRQVAILKKILRNCLWKHVISAFKGLTEERPIVLLSWGCRFFMNAVDEGLVKEFIKTHANNGPEERYDQGFYTKGLIRAAWLITDKNDTMLCPKVEYPM